MGRNSALLIAFLGIVTLALGDEPTPPTPTPDPTFTCPSKEDSFEPHPTDCTRFYRCTHGDAWLMQCDAGLYFNPDTDECDWPSEVDCKASPSSHMMEIQGQECLEKGNYSCTENGAWPHEELCEYYYDCWEGEATLCRCTDGYLFDLTYMGCNFPEDVDCGERINPDPTPATRPPKTTTPPGTGPTQPGDDFVCPKDEGLFPNPKDCSTYYQCNGGYAFLENCPPNLVFNPRTLNCDYLENVPECDGVSPAPTTTTTKSNSTDEPEPTPTDIPVTTVRPSTPGGGEFVCPKDEGLFPNPADCSTYYQCDAGIAYLEECPPDLVFNPRTLNCDYLENVPECDGNQPPATTTTPRNNSTGAPVTTIRPSTPGGGEFACPEKTGFFPNPDDCFTFYVCVDGNAVLVPCPDGLAYDPRTLDCNYPELVPGCH